MNSLHRSFSRADLRCEVILSFVVRLAGHIIDVEVEIQSAANRFCNSEVQDVQTRSPDRRICSIKTVITDMPIAERRKDVVPSRQCQASIGGRVWSAIDINSR